jgi:hypothetical protein
MTPDIPIDDAATASSLCHIAAGLGLPLHTRRRSIATGQASVGSSSVLPLSRFFTALLRYHCALRFLAVSLPSNLLPQLALPEKLFYGSQMFFR